MTSSEKNLPSSVFETMVRFPIVPDLVSRMSPFLVSVQLNRTL